MNTVTVKGVGIITIPERNTEEEIIHIVNQLKDDVVTLNEMLEIKPIEIFWCEHEECLEEIGPFDSEEELVSHICKCHLECVSCSKELNPIQNHQKVALSQS
jgi:hypothetical protein